MARVSVGFFEKIIFQLHKEGINISLFCKTDLIAEVKPSLTTALNLSLFLYYQVLNVLPELFAVYVHTGVPGDNKSVFLIIVRGFAITLH